LKRCVHSKVEGLNFVSTQNLIPKVRSGATYKAQLVVDLID